MGLIRLYRNGRNKNEEFCFYIQSESELTKEESEKLSLILAEGFIADTIRSEPKLTDSIVEIGPRLSFATAFSTHLVSICHACGLTSINRIERSLRYAVQKDDISDGQASVDYDNMTQMIYSEPLKTFVTNSEIEPVREVPLKEFGKDGFSKIPGLSIPESDMDHYLHYFLEVEGRNPTDVEMFDLMNANSEHSRHGFFTANLVIDDEPMPYSLMELVKAPLRANPDRSTIAFSDNSSAIEGGTARLLFRTRQGGPSAFRIVNVPFDIILTAETHNYPSGVAPFPGANTGAGGRLRDIFGVGLGGLIRAGTAGYCVGSLFIPNYDLPWEKYLRTNSSLASPLKIIIEASNGASDYGNKFGEPVIQGFARSFDQVLPEYDRWGFLKPIMFSGGIGQMLQCHREKKVPDVGDLIVQIGGPAYNIGFCGGSLSSFDQLEDNLEQDLNGVQRGDAEMGQKVYRVMASCVEMLSETCIVIDHDQGAGGPANVLKELVEKYGGWVEIREIQLGDKTLSKARIWVCEYQERMGLVIKVSRIEEFKAICKRERVNCEVLGKVTGDGRFVVHDSLDDTTPVNLDLKQVLSGLPQKEYTDKRIHLDLPPLEIPSDLTFIKALENVFKLMSVGSKRFLTNKVDRSVTGLVVQQQCCGPLQLPVSDVAVVADSYFDTTGAATSIGEQPIKMLIDPKAGARMAIGEALTNLIGTKISNRKHIKVSGNWMWASKLPGEGAAIYDAATALKDFMIALKIAIDGGKDSLSMATDVDGQKVKSPRQLVISAYAPVEDISKVTTPDLKHPGESSLLYLNFSNLLKRLGGSAFAQTLGQIGNDCPDIENPEVLAKVFDVVQTLVEQFEILSCHDVSDGGLIVTLVEMAFSGNCGFNVNFLKSNNTLFEELFSEELGIVLEVENDKLDLIRKFLSDEGVSHIFLGITTKEKNITAKFNDVFALDNSPMEELRSIWERTSFELESLQMNPECAKEESLNIHSLEDPDYILSFAPEIVTPPLTIIPVCVLREEGCNSDKEMAAVLHMAGFEPWDVTVSDLLDGRITLDVFQGIVTVGGFPFADDPDSAKGSASCIKLNSKLFEMFEEFRERSDTFTFGECSGCQLNTLLGWVPGNCTVESQPLFVQNKSRRFESRWSTVKIQESPSIMLKGMEGSIIPVWVAHGEGQLHFPDDKVLANVIRNNLSPVRYVDHNGNSTFSYPFNPNGSIAGMTSLCSEDGRHLVMMPHPSRAFQMWQWPWVPESMKSMKVSPWLQMFINARLWCNFQNI